MGRTGGLALVLMAAMGCGGRVVVDGEPSGNGGGGSSATSTTVTTTGSVGSPDGAACVYDMNCASGFCVDGVCCATACKGSCMACSAAKTGGVDGVCGPIPSGQDPDYECIYETACDGQGACSTECGGKTCQELGFACGVCEQSTLDCNDGEVPMSGWDTVYAPEEGDTIVEVSVNSDLSERCDSINGGGGVAPSPLNIGNPQDAVAGHIAVGGVSFDLSSLPPDAKIVSAKAELFQNQGYGAAFKPPMSQVVVEHIRYVGGSEVCDTPANPATIGTQVLSDSPKSGWRSFDLTTAVRHDLASCRDRTQIRFGFAPQRGIEGGDKNGVSFYINPSKPNSAPKLTIRYR